jgi:hypothetical protein
MTPNNVPLWHTISAFALLHGGKYESANVYVKYGKDYKGRKKGYTTERHVYAINNVNVHVCTPNKPPSNASMQSIVITLFDGTCTVIWRGTRLTYRLDMEMLNTTASRKDLTLRLDEGSTTIVLS